MIDQRKKHVTFGSAFSDFFKGFVDFNGYSSRAGHWFPVGTIHVGFLIVLIVFFYSVFASFAGITSRAYRNYDYFSGNSFADAASTATTSIAVIFILIVIGIIILIPITASYARRLRDVGFTNWGLAILIVLFYLLNYFTIYIISFIYVIGFFFVLMSLPSNALETNKNDDFIKFFVRQTPQAKAYYSQFVQYDQFGNPIPNFKQGGQFDQFGNPINRNAAYDRNNQNAQSFNNQRGQGNFASGQLRPNGQGVNPRFNGQNSQYNNQGQNFNHSQFNGNSRNANPNNQGQFNADSRTTQGFNPNQNGQASFNSNEQINPNNQGENPRFNNQNVEFNTQKQDFNSNNSQFNTEENETSPKDVDIQKEEVNVEVTSREENSQKAAQINSRNDRLQKRNTGDQVIYKRRKK
ncbi:DUF805 domain-containing protein [Gemella bergeri]